jgi:uncharacterized protein RhaS with RHS repeats
LHPPPLLQPALRRQRPPEPVAEGNDVGAGGEAGGAGNVYDEESGLRWTRFRCFDAETGRWQSAGPLGLMGGVETFGFDGAPTTIGIRSANAELNECSS